MSGNVKIDEFLEDIQFQSPEKFEIILEGKGKKRRHIKIRRIEDIQEKKVKNFIASAMHMDEV